jgi:hypothetical protein
MEIERIFPGLEKPFRQALGHAMRNEIEDMRRTLAELSQEQVMACLGLCLFVAGYVAIEVCGRLWPDEDNLRKIAERTTKSTNAREFGLKAENAYAYLKRAALRLEPLDDVFPSMENAVTLSFVITGHIVTAYCPADMEWWEYLNKIEDILEASEAADLGLLPALMLRSRRLAQRGESLQR